MVRNRWMADAALVNILANAAAAEVQCPPQWWPEFTDGTIAGSVSSLAEFDDDAAGPLPPVLYVGGTFESAFGVTAKSIARYDASAWSAVGGGLDGPSGTTHARALAVFDEDGAGPLLPSLFVAGTFENAGGFPADGIARWNGVSWSAVGTGFSGDLAALTIFDDDGTGPNAPALYAAGSIIVPGGATSVAKWDGSSWTAVGPSTNNGGVKCLAVFDADGEGPDLPSLYAAGSFTTIGGLPVRRIARWTGEQWVEVGGGITPCQNCSAPHVFALEVFDEDGEGPNHAALFAGGLINVAGGVPVQGIAKWDGTTWSNVGGGVSGNVHTMSVFDEDADGPGLPALYVGGLFYFAGDLVYANNLARWDGFGWSSVVGGVNNSVWAFGVFDSDGSGPTRPGLYVGGSFSQAAGILAGRIAHWGSGGPSPIMEVQPVPKLIIQAYTQELAELFVWAVPTAYFSVQWRKDGTPLSDTDEVSGTNDWTLYFFGLDESWTGVYDAVISNGECATVSDPTVLTVESLPWLIAANPPLDNPFLPGEQGFRDVLQPGPDARFSQGIGAAGTPDEGTVQYSAIRVTFDKPFVTGLTPDMIDLDIIGGDMPTVVSVTGTNPYEITLSSPIPPAALTRINFEGTTYEQQIEYQSLPGDLNMNDVVSPADVLSLVGAINSGAGDETANLPRYDVNRSGDVTASDLLRLVQLLNGVNASQAWVGVTLPCT